MAKIVVCQPSYGSGCGIFPTSCLKLPWTQASRFCSFLPTVGLIVAIPVLGKQRMRNMVLCRVGLDLVRVPVAGGLSSTGHRRSTITSDRFRGHNTVAQLNLTTVQTRNHVLRHPIRSLLDRWITSAKQVLAGFSSQVNPSRTRDKQLPASWSFGSLNNLACRILASLVEVRHRSLVSTRCSLSQDAALPPGDPGRGAPDMIRVRDDLGWEPNMPLKKGLRRAIAYFRRPVCVQTGTTPSLLATS